MLGVATTNEGRVLRSRCVRDARLLVVDDDEPVRTLYVALLENVAGVGPVVAAGDGADAVQVAKKLALDVAVLDLNMPRLDGIEAALALAALQPSLSIALHSSDPDTLRQRARGLDFAVFDKVEFDRLVAWVEGEVERLRRPRPQLRPLRLRDRHRRAARALSDVQQRNRVDGRRTRAIPCVRLLISFR